MARYVGAKMATPTLEIAHTVSEVDCGFALDPTTPHNEPLAMTDSQPQCLVKHAFAQPESLNLFLPTKSVHKL